jgi:hypothetical protein
MSKWGESLTKSFEFCVSGFVLASGGAQFDAYAIVAASGKSL